MNWDTTNVVGTTWQRAADGSVFLVLAARRELDGSLYVKIDEQWMNIGSLLAAFSQVNL